MIDENRGEAYPETALAEWKRLAESKANRDAAGGDRVADLIERIDNTRRNYAYFDAHWPDPQSSAWHSDRDATMQHYTDRRKAYEAEIKPQILDVLYGATDLLGSDDPAITEGKSDLEYGEVNPLSQQASINALARIRVALEKI